MECILLDHGWLIIKETLLESHGMIVEMKGLAGYLIKICVECKYK